MASPQPIRRRQTLAAATILAVLCVIASGVYFKQFHYDRSAYHASAPRGPASAPAALDLAGASSGLLVPAGRDESYDSDNLWIKINGKAEGYLPFGFVRLDCRRLALPGRAGESVEAFVYDMGSPQGALSVFARQRRRDGRDLEGLGLHAYASGGAIFLAHGRFYVELLPAGQSPELQKATQELARRVQAVLPGAGQTAARLEGEDLLPAAGRRPGSVWPMPAEQTGQPALGKVLTALYEIDGKQGVAFVSPQPSGQKAAELASAYVVSLLNGGWDDQGEAAPGTKMVSQLGTYRVVFAAGGAVAGVHECEDRATAVKLSRLLKDHLAGQGK